MNNSPTKFDQTFRSPNTCGKNAKRCLFYLYICVAISVYNVMHGLWWAGGSLVAKSCRRWGPPQPIFSLAGCLSLHTALHSRATHGKNWEPSLLAWRNFLTS